MREQLVLISKRTSHDQEWPATLTAEILGSYGWGPIPFTEFVLKVHSRCNLACDYCYIYEMADTSWNSQPGSMTSHVARKAADRIAVHVRRHTITDIFVTLHGGEPLLVGKQRLLDLLDIFWSTLNQCTNVHFAIQTNGTLLDNEFLSTLNGYDVKVGISLDGGQQANDKHRVRRDKSSPFQTIAGRIRSFQTGPFAGQFAGILATLDVTNDPVETYKDLRSFDPPKIDFLLPHGNWEQPPPFLPRDAAELASASRSTPYADWLIELFNYWFSSPDDEPGIRLFDHIIRLVKGRTSALELLGLQPATVISLQTDGTYELVDTLKSTFNGAANTNKNVFDHDIDSLLFLPDIAARQIGINALHDTCQKCEIVSLCGGGYYPHRYNVGSGFLNRSVYCQDLLKLITHITFAVKNADPT